jgi:hypothetical protein
VLVDFDDTLAAAPTWHGEEADNPRPAAGPWFRTDDLTTFADEIYPVIAEFDATGDTGLLQSRR